MRGAGTLERYHDATATAATAALDLLVLDHHPIPAVDVGADQALPGGMPHVAVAVHGQVDHEAVQIIGGGGDVLGRARDARRRVGCVAAAADNDGTITGGNIYHPAREERSNVAQRDGRDDDPSTPLVGCRCREGGGEDGQVESIDQGQSGAAARASWSVHTVVPRGLTQILRTVVESVG